MIEVCPKCKSAKVEEDGVVVLSNDARGVHCNSCGWKGAASELEALAYLPKGSYMVNVDPALVVAREVSEDYLVHLASLASRNIGEAMVVSGVIGAANGKRLARLIKAATLGAHKATLDEIDKMQAELRVGDSDGN